MTNLTFTMTTHFTLSCFSGRMAGNDIRDILNMARPGSVDSLDQRPPAKKKKLEPTKRPTGMHREVFALLGSGNELDPPPLQKGHDKGLRHMKQLFGNRKVCDWIPNQVTPT